MLLKRLSAPLAALAVVVFPAFALAQSSVFRLPSAGANYRDAEAQVPYYEARRTAYDQGYREGLKEGQKDARGGDRFAYQDEREFQRADRGYHRSFGDRERYRQVFRDGYAAGYSEGFSRLAGYRRDNGRYGQGPYAQGPYRQQGRYGNGPYASSPNAYYSPAFDNGARDGFEKGQEDVRKRRSFDPLRHSWYRSGDRHYEGRYGSRDQYKDVYRRGFQQGYEHGFRESRYSW